MGEKTPEEKHLQIFTKCLHSIEDRYGRNYKLTLARSKEKEHCFICRTITQPYNKILTCLLCNYTYFFCKTCLKEKKILFGFNRCIYCMREYNDTIAELLINKTTKVILPLDFFGFQRVELLLKEKAKERRERIESESFNIQ